MNDLVDIHNFLTQRVMLIVPEEDRPALQARLTLLEKCINTQEALAESLVRWKERAKNHARKELELQAEIDKLGNFIEHKVDGEPSKDEGVIECAIRLIGVGRIKIRGAGYNGPPPLQRPTPPPPPPPKRRW